VRNFVDTLRRRGEGGRVIAPASLAWPPRSRRGRSTPHRLALLVLLACAACRGERAEEIEVTVSHVALDPASRSPVVVLEDADHTMALPIWIGPAEAQAIASRLEGLESPRPQTHDLMKNVLDRIGVELRKVVIRDLKDNTYNAHLVLGWDGDEVAIDSRPSDAIALAVRFGQPIFVSRALMERENVVALRSAPALPSLTVGTLTVQALSEELAGFFALPHGQGVVVADVARSGRGGLQRGDVILEVDGAPVRSPEDFRSKMTARPPSTALAVHRDGTRIEVAVGPNGEPVD
jgi:bifunctional DNase/RNase